jgi:hypothetical protein
VFLDTNGQPVTFADDDAFRLVMAIAEGTLDVEDIVDQLSPE